MTPLALKGGADVPEDSSRFYTDYWDGGTQPPTWAPRHHEFLWVPDATGTHALDEDTGLLMWTLSADELPGERTWASTR